MSQSPRTPPGTLRPRLRATLLPGPSSVDRTDHPPECQSLHVFIEDRVRTLGHSLAATLSSAPRVAWAGSGGRGPCDGPLQHCALTRDKGPGVRDVPLELSKMLSRISICSNAMFPGSPHRGL